MDDMSGPSGQQVAVGKAIRRLIDAGKVDREKWLTEGDEIERYTTSNDYGFLYQSFPGDMSMRARVNKASEFQQIYGAFLYPNNPDAVVQSESWADFWAQQRHKVEEQYADYAAKHGDLAVHMRRAVDHALLYGRAPLWCGFNANKGIVQNVFYRSNHLLLDPDAKNFEEVNWQARERFKPRWELASRYPDQKALIETLPGYTDPKEKVSKDRVGDRWSEMVCYYEVWMGVSPANYDQSLAIVGGDGRDLQAKKKYCISDGKIIHEGDWEIPFFMIDEWPGTCLDLMEKPGSLWPTQPMEPGMGHLRAMNWVYTELIAKYLLMSRTPFAAMSINGNAIAPDQLFKILEGESIDILTMKVNGDENPDINKYFQRINWGDPLPGFQAFWDVLSREFEKSTGLAEVLYAGQTRTQIRTATAADLIESNSKLRSDAMRERVAQFLTRIFRKTIFAARFLHGTEDISKFFGARAGAVWGELGSPDAVAQEAQMRQMLGEQLAQQSMMMGAAPDPVAIEQQMGPPQFVDMSTWINEADRTIDAGSMRRIDVDGQMQNLNVALNQLGPAVVNMPGGAEFVGALASEFTKLNRFSPELQAAANNIISQIQQAKAMGMAPQPGPSPEAGPKSGPEGGKQGAP